MEIQHFPTKNERVENIGLSIYGAVPKNIQVILSNIPGFHD